MQIKFPNKLIFVVIFVFWVFVCGSVLYLNLNLLNLPRTLIIKDVLLSVFISVLPLALLFVLFKFVFSLFSKPINVIAIGLAYIIKCCYLQKFVVNQIYNNPGVYEDSFWIRIITLFFIISGFVFLMWVLQHIKKLNKHYELQLESQKNNQEAELIKLRQQIQPHFLFNSLNSINALVISKPKQAREMVQNLSGFLRGTIKKEDSKLVTLKEEYSLLNLYLDIEKVRFGNRLTINSMVNKACLDMLLPPLILQPILENAIKYGLYNTIDEVILSIAINPKNEGMQIEIQNPYDEESSVTRKGEGFGLMSIEKRLNIIYRRNDLLQIQKNNKVFITSVYIPKLK